MKTLSTRLAVFSFVLLALATLPGAAPARAQEIPQPISRPCKHPCPNRIKLADAPRLDALELHARVVPLSSIDPANETFAFELTDVNGDTIFVATLAAGDLRDTNGGKRTLYRNPAAKRTGGLYSVLITPRHDASEGYRVDIRAYGDFTPPATDDITTFIAIGNDPFFDSRAWTKRQDGWAVDFTP